MGTKGGDIGAYSADGPSIAIGVNYGTLTMQGLPSSNFGEPPLTAEELFEGPIQTLGLAELVQSADTLEKENRYREAAEKFASIARSLERSQFAPLADEYHRRVAFALFRDSRFEESAEILMNLSWHTLLVEFAPLRARSWWNQVSGEKFALPPAQKRAFEALHLAMAAFQSEADVSGQLTLCLNELMADSPFRLEFAVFVAEWFVTFLQRAPDPKSISMLNGISSDSLSTDQDLKMRLDTCLAEFSGDWTILPSTTSHSRRLRAWQHARRGRAEALRRPGVADQYYRRAVADAFPERMWNEARWWNASRWKPRWWSGTIMLKETQSQHRMLQTLPATETAQAVPGNVDLNELTAKSRSLAVLRSRIKFAEIWLWSSVVGGYIEKELEACLVLASLYADAKRPAKAMLWACRAGDSDTALKIAKDLPEEPLFLLPSDPFLITSQSKPVALKTLSFCVDLIPDNIAKQWHEEARIAILDKSSHHHPDMFNSALSALAVTSDVIDEGPAAETLDAIEESLQSGFPSGDAILQTSATTMTLVSIGREHRNLRDRAMRAIMTLATEENSRYSADLLNQGADILPSVRQMAVELLEERLKFEPENSELHQLYLATTTEDIPDIVQEFIAERAARISTWSPPTGTSRSQRYPFYELYYVAPHLSSTQMTRIADRLIDEAECRDELATNRRSALRELDKIAPYIKKLEIRSSVFQRCLKIAMGEFDGSVDDHDRERYSDPLSFFQIKGSYSSIRGTGLLAASALADGTNESESAVNTAIYLLQTEFEPKVLQEIATALVRLPNDSVPNSILELMAAHSEPEVRAVAAVCLARSSISSNALLTLAADKSSYVRRSLAEAIKSDADPSNDRFAEVLRNLRVDPRRSVRALAQDPLDTAT